MKILTNKVVYAVFQQGIYRHECLGIFSSESAAKETADAAAQNEKDAYHSFVVVPFEVDKAGEFSEYFSEYSEPKSTYRGLRKWYFTYNYLQEGLNCLGCIEVLASTYEAAKEKIIASKYRRNWINQYFNYKDLPETHTQIVETLK